MSTVSEPAQGQGLNVRVEKLKTPRLMYILGIMFIVFLLFGMFSTVISPMRPRARKVHAQLDVHTLSVALEAYKMNYGSYPPEPPMGTSGGKQLFLYLATPTTPAPGTTLGPLVKWKNVKANELLSLWGYPYEYHLITDSKGVQHYLVIDPGPDGKLGGTIDPQKCFIRTNSDADDNLSTEQ